MLRSAQLLARFSVLTTSSSGFVQATPCSAAAQARGLATGTSEPAAKPPGAAASSPPDLTASLRAKAEQQLAELAAQRLQQAELPSDGNEGHEEPDDVVQASAGKH